MINYPIIGISQPFSKKAMAQASRIIVSFPMVAVWPALRIGTWAPAEWWTSPLERSTDKRSPSRSTRGAVG